MENEKTSPQCRLEAYDYFYYVIDNSMQLNHVTTYDNIQQVLDKRPQRGNNWFIITFVNVKNGEKTMHRYVVYDGKAYDMYDGDTEYLKSRVFVLSGVTDYEMDKLAYVVHIGYDGLMYDLAGMDGTTYGFKTHVIDWETDTEWRISVFDETDTDKIMCMDFMAFLYSRRLTYGLMTKKDIDKTTEMCVKYGFMKEKPEPSICLKDILFNDEDPDDIIPTSFYKGIHSKSITEL